MTRRRKHKYHEEYTSTITHSRVDDSITVWGNGRWASSFDIESPKLGSHLLGTRAKVNAAFSMRSLRWHLLAPINDYLKEGEAVATTTGVYVYADRGFDVLAVAHLDSVANAKAATITNEKGDRIVYARTVDDRVGAYVILDLLPKLGIKTDILLTEGEESMMSTAMFFETKKKYKWVFEFDRNGTDVVMYDYETKEHKATLEKYGFKVGIGSVSDISYLEDLGVTCFNFGTGYYLNHTEKAHVNVDRLIDNVARFVPFYHDHRDKTLPYTPVEKPHRVFTGRESYASKDFECRCGNKVWAVYPTEYRPCWKCKQEIIYHAKDGTGKTVSNYCPHCKEKGTLTRYYQGNQRNLMNCSTCKKNYEMHYSPIAVNDKHFFLLNIGAMPPAGSESVPEPPKQISAPIPVDKDRATLPEPVSKLHPGGICEGCSMLTEVTEFEMTSDLPYKLTLCEDCYLELVEICPYCYSNILILEKHDYCPNCYSELY